MSEVRELVAKLIALGVDAVDAAEVVTRAVLAGASRNGDRAAERRRAWDRERKKEKRRVDSTGIPPDRVDDDLKTKGSPTPPPKTQSSAPPLPPTGEFPPRGRKASMAPESWEPSAKVLAWAEAEGFTAGEIERELAKFRDYEFPKPKSNWDAAFRNWLRNASDRRPSLRVIHGQSSNNSTGYRGEPGKSGTETLLQSVARQIAGRERDDGG